MKIRKHQRLIHYWTLSVNQAFNSRKKITTMCWIDFVLHKSCQMKSRVNFGETTLNLCKIITNWTNWQFWPINFLMQENKPKLTLSNNFLRKDCPLRQWFKTISRWFWEECINFREESLLRAVFGIFVRFAFHWKEGSPNSFLNKRKQSSVVLIIGNPAKSFGGKWNRVARWKYKSKSVLAHKII